METNNSTAGSTLLTQLRNDPSLSYCNLEINDVVKSDDQYLLEARTTMSLILRHQSEFPLKVREEIQAATAANPPLTPEFFCEEVHECLGRLLVCEPRMELHDDENPGAGAATTWNGLDSEVDTEDEVETAVRLFPSVLEFGEVSYFGKPPRTRLLTPIFWVSTSIKSLRFVPLLTDLAVDLGLSSRLDRALFSTYHLVTNDVLIEYREFELRQDVEFERRLDEVFLPIMIRLKEKGFLQEDNNYRAAAAVLNRTQYCAEKRLRFLIDLDPSILRGSNTLRNETLLMRMVEEGKSIDPIKLLPTLQMLIEVGVSKYPEEIGFLFHKDYSESFVQLFGSWEYSFALCDFFGKEIVVDRVNRIISKNTAGRPGLLRAMFVAAATKPKIIVDGLYFLCRRDPTSLISFLQKERKVLSRKRKLKTR